MKNSKRNVEKEASSLKCSSNLSEGHNLKRTNVMCIVGFVCSLLSSILGVIFCGIGLGQVKKSEEKGSNLANAGIIICFVRTMILIIIPYLFVYPSITPNLVLSTACANVDENGNYETKGPNISSGDDGYVICENYYCQAFYKGKAIKRDCNKK